MLKTRLVALLIPTLAALWAVAGAAPARADDLYLTVERTAGSKERPRLDVRASQPGTIQVQVERLERPDLLARFALEGLDVSRPEQLGKALEAHAFLLRSEPVRELPAGAPAGPAAARPVAYPTANQRATLDLDPLPAGLYVVSARQAALTARALLLVSDLALLTKRDAGGLLAWAVQRASGEPLPDVTVEVWAGGHAPLAQARTGSDGLARLTGAFPAQVRVVAVRAADWALGGERWYATDVPARRVWMVTQQPAYRPGERVEVKGVVRAVAPDGSPTLDPTAQEVRVLFVAPGDRVLGESRARVSADLGTFDAGFTLPPDAPTGAGEVRAEIGGHPYSAPLVLDAYRRPPFEVRVSPAQPRALAGTDVAFQVTARGYDGSTLPGQKLSWMLLHHRVEPDLFPEDEFVRLFFGSEREAFAPTTLAQGEGALDAASSFGVRSVLPADLADGYVTLRATVVGPDGLHVAGSGVCGLSASPIRVGLVTDRHLYGPEDSVFVTIRVERADGQPAVGRAGTLALVRHDGPADEERHLADPTFVTDERGEARGMIPLPAAGRFTVVARVPRAADEPAGAPAQAERSVWAVGEHTTLGYAGERLEVVADKDAYAVGETARLLVLSPMAGRALLATLEGATLLEARVLSPDGHAALYTVALGETHAPNVWVAFAGIDQGNLVSGSRLLRIPPVTRLLSTQVAPDAPDLAPGAVSGATITVTDAAGQPVAGAEVSLAVVDEALHALFPDAGASLAAFFHPLRRNAVSSGGPLHLKTVGHAHAETQRQDKAGHDGPAPTGGAVPAPRPAEGPPPPGSPAPLPRREAEERERAAPGADPASLADGDGESEAKKLKDDAGPATAQTRADFRTSVFWAAALRTGSDGRVRAEGIHYADTLTRWRLSAHALDASTRVGSAAAQVRTKKDLAVEVALPRFLRVGDRPRAPILVTNLGEQAVEGGAYAWWSLSPPADEGGRRPNLTLPPGVAQETGHLGPAPTQPGTLHVLAVAEAGAARDVLRRSIPVLPQGFEASASTYEEALDPGAAGSVALALEVPPDFDRSTLRAQVAVEPSLLSAALRALPYLVEFPYGCTEQTLSRFEPLLIVAAVMDALKVPRQGVLAEVPKAVAAGVERLAALQHEDGGFGWWPTDATNLEMTARAVRGLTRAARLAEVRERAAALLPRALERLAALMAGPATADAPAAALALLALAEAQALPAGALERGLDTLAAERAGPLSLALYLRATLAAGRRDLAAPLVARLKAMAVKTVGGIAFALGGEGAAPPERWQEDPVETTATALLALFEAGETGVVLEQGARWLLAHRDGGEVWRSTRDTAAAVAFLRAYGAASAQQTTSRTYRVLQGERLLGTLTLEGVALTSGNATLDVSALLADTARVDVRVEGPGAFGATLILSGFATGPAIQARNAGFRVERRWFRLEPTPREGRVVQVRVPLTETLPAGALVECEVTVTSDRARDYAQISSPHAAGFEPEREVGLEVPGRTPATPAQVERYDDRTEFFVARLPAGTHVFRHTLRATHAGAYTALPARARLMYFPGVMGSSAGEVLEVTVGVAKGGGR